MGFVRLVKRLFTFIEAVRSRNWDLYLSSFEAMIKDFTSFDRIKYRRWSAVYLTDMFSLKDSDDLEDRKVWQAFSNGDFSCQKSAIPGTAIGRDHCGEQENRKIKNRGGIKGITMNPNSRTRHFLAVPVLASITDQMFDLGGHITRSTTKHHQLNNAYIRRQNEAVNSLLQVLEEHLSFSEISSPFMNIITGQIYSDQITEDMLCFEKTGNMVYKQFIDERLKPNSTKSIHEPLKRVMLNTCKSSIKPKKLKINDKTKELRGNCNLFARCALIRGQRDIDMKVVVGDYELTVYPKSLFSSDGSLLDGSKSKSEAVTELLKYTGYKPSNKPPANPYSVVFNAMRVLNEMVTKHFKTGKNLVNEV